MPQNGFNHVTPTVLDASTASTYVPVQGELLWRSDLNELRTGGKTQDVGGERTGRLPMAKRLFATSHVTLTTNAWTTVPLNETPTLITRGSSSTVRYLITANINWYVRSTASARTVPDEVYGRVFNVTQNAAASTETFGVITYPINWSGMTLEEATNAPVIVDANANDVIRVEMYVDDQDGRGVTALVQSGSSFYFLEVAP